MLAEDFSSLQVAQYELHLRALQPASLPTFLGSTLRGAFGNALKQAVCVVAHRECERCLLKQKCIYPLVFETPPPPDIELLKGQKNAPHPFIFIPPFSISRSKSAQAEVVEGENRCRLERHDELIFNLLLMGEAIGYLPYLIYAVSEMAAQGLGVNRTPFALERCFAIEEGGAKKSIYTRDNIIPHRADKSLSALISARLVEGASNTNSQLKLRFQTPTRIRIEGHLQAGMSFQLLVRNLLRRVSLLIAVHSKSILQLNYRELIEKAASVTIVSSRLQWDDWERYSNRQKTKMNLGGFVGEIVYQGEAIKEYLPLLVAGEILHVGAGTSFGLGKLEMVR